MANERWLMLTDYSSKYRVSVSTLRRRIKNNQIPFRFENGKYFLIDASPSHPEVTAHQKATPFFDGLKTLVVESNSDVSAAPSSQVFPHARLGRVPDFLSSSLLPSAPMSSAPTSMMGMDSALNDSSPTASESYNEFSAQLDSEMGLPPRHLAPDAEKLTLMEPGVLPNDQNPPHDFESRDESFSEGPDLTEMGDEWTQQSVLDAAHMPPTAGDHGQDFSSLTHVEGLPPRALYAPYGTLPRELAYAPAISPGETAEPFVSTATNLLSELKRAYANVLQQKEEQMIQLKEEVSDLKTLVRVLEDDSERLRRQLRDLQRAIEISYNSADSTI